MTQRKNVLSEPSAVSARATILLVEDDPPLLECTAELLRYQGYAVIPARDAEEALRVTQSGAAVDVLFADLKLPGPMKGCQLATEIRQLRPALPVLLTSGNFACTSCVEQKDTIFLMKPYKFSELEAALAKVLNRPQPYARPA